MQREPMNARRMDPLRVPPEAALEVDQIVGAMGVRQLAKQLGGRRGLHALSLWTYRLGPYRSGGSPDHDVPPLAFTDGPRGINLGRSTAFPSASSRGASWDPALEHRVGEAMGKEARAQGATAVGSACINLVRHPGWGRAQETLGADPHHVGALGAAHVRGLREHVLPVVKHFALNSIENSRFFVDVQIDECSLREVYLPHFFETIGAGAGAVMSAYNKVNGTYCGEHPELFRILRDDWGFEGFTTSDFILGTRSTVAAMQAGLDQEMPQAWYYRPSRLAKLVKRGELSIERLRDAARRVLRARAACGVLRPGAAPPVDTDKHQALALESACASIVVARDLHGLLPVAQGTRLGVVGRLAAQPNDGSIGSVSVAPPFCVTAIDGLRDAFAEVIHEPRMKRHAIDKLAAKVDQLILFVGAGPHDEGEYFPLLGGGDRTSIDLPDAQIRAIEAAAKTGRPPIVVWVGGGLPAFGSWQKSMPCLIMMGHGGMRGGEALARVLAGASIGGGHLTACVANSADELVPFDPSAREVQYDRFFDYRRYDRDGVRPLFWVGHGSAQTSLDAELIGVSIAPRDGEARPVESEPNGWALGTDESLRVSLRVHNRGPMDAAPVVTLFVAPAPAEIRDAAAVERAPFSLRAFDKRVVATGESVVFTLELPASALAEWDPDRAAWVRRPGGRELVYSLAGGPRVRVGHVQARTAG